MPAAENPQGLRFRLSQFLRFWVGGLSRRLLSPAWPSWSSADARLAKLCLFRLMPIPPTPRLKALESLFLGSKIKVIFDCVFEAPRFPPRYRGFGALFGVTSTYLRSWRGVRPSYVRCQEIGGQTGPMMALGGLLGA